MTHRIRAAVTWPFRQVSRFLSNAAEAYQATTWRDLLPPSLLSLLSWLRDQLPRAAGYDTPARQITSSFVLAIVMVISSLGLLTPLALVMVIPLSIGLLRLWPAVDDRWPLGRS